MGAAVPWARHGAGHTHAFDEQVAWLATQCSKSAVTELMRVAWRTVGAIITRVWEDVEKVHDRFAGLSRIGIVNRIARTRSSSGYFGGAATVPPCSLLFVQPGTSQRAAGPSRLRVRGAGPGTSTQNGQSSQHAVDRLVQQGAGGSEVQPEAVSVARAVLRSLG